MWGLLNKGYFSGDFLKTSLAPPFALFQKLRVLGDLPKIAITWLFGLFEAAFLTPKSSPVFALKEHVNKRIMPFAPE